jgi:hypothetical protein
MTEPAPYKEAFPKGTQVRIADQAFLEGFMTAWKYHHKLQLDQLPFAERLTTVEEVSFYHGGEPIYRLTEIPGLWLEQCLRQP